MDIVIAAVGGQGAVLTSQILGQYARLSGLDVKLSEVHGMSQRGGSVVTHVRFDQRVCSPVIERGRADAVLGLELLEAARFVGFLRVGGCLIANTARILPLPVLTGTDHYPEHLGEALRALPIHCHFVDATDQAGRLGSVKVANTLLLGVLAFALDMPVQRWREALIACVPKAYLDMNLAAFELGCRLASGSGSSPPSPKGRTPS